VTYEKRKDSADSQAKPLTVQERVADEGVGHEGNEDDIESDGETNVDGVVQWKTPRRDVECSGFETIDTLLVDRLVVAVASILRNEAGEGGRGRKLGRSRDGGHRRVGCGAVVETGAESTTEDWKKNESVKAEGEKGRKRTVSDQFRLKLGDRVLKLIDTIRPDDHALLRANEGGMLSRTSVGEFFHRLDDLNVVVGGEGEDLCVGSEGRSDDLDDVCGDGDGDLAVELVQRGLEGLKALVDGVKDVVASSETDGNGVLSSFTDPLTTGAGAESVRGHEAGGGLRLIVGGGKRVSNVVNLAVQTGRKHVPGECRIDDSSCANDWSTRSGGREEGE
jgi:hypothetical protein